MDTKNNIRPSQKEISRPCGHPSTWGKQRELTLDVEHLPIDSPWMLNAAPGEWPSIRKNLILVAREVANNDHCHGAVLIQQVGGLAAVAAMTFDLLLVGWGPLLYTRLNLLLLA